LDITCTSCNRSFQLDPERAKKFPAARCLCGARLRLNTDPNLAAQGPQRLGKYVLLQRIAVGGMGEIFYGKIAGVEGFEREVAIKKMLPHLSEDRAFVDMMVKEAKLTVMLHHPNIVQVYDLAREGKEYYIAMEFVPGVTVGHLLERCHRERTRLPFEVAVHISMQVLRGLAYAHDLRDSNGEPMNILHRDITPQNILVTRNAWVKITDFGIAKARNEISTTSPGMIKGKLGYIAPEQLSGGMPDQRVDIFCAGILLWESIATRRLFKGADEIDTFRLISECRVPPLANFRDDVPPEIEKALLGGLKRLPEQRYRTADAFYDALNQSIFPNTADEYANISKKYFESHPEFFESIAKLVDAAPADGLTVELEAPADEKLVEVTDLVPTAKKPSGRLLAAVASLLLVLFGVGFVFRDDLRTWLKPPPEPVRGSENRLTTEDVQLAVDGERARFQECCAEGGPAFRKVTAVTARLVIPSTGGVAEIVLDPPKDKLGKAGPCVERVLAQLKFRPHTENKVIASVNLPSPKDCPAPGSTTPPPPPPGTEKPLTGPEIQAAVQRSSGSITSCIGQLAGVASAPNKVNATITIAQTGRVSEVALAPPIGVPAVEQCLRRALMSLRFRRQPQKDFKVTIPLSIQQI
jgi:serine/threonine protein kinase